MQGPEENKLTVRELVEVQKLENDSNDVLTTLEANINILISLQDFYQDLVDSKMDFPAASSRGEVESFVKKLKDFRADIERNQTRASRLVRLTADKRSLVCHELYFTSNFRLQSN
jgi:GTP1/Obg family GTP-binding protein